MANQIPIADSFDRQVLSSDSPLPLYLQLARLIGRMIDEGHLVDKDALPSERDLAARFSVSRVTVRKALQQLIGDGLLHQRQGAGTFVSSRPRVEQRLSTLTSFTEDMESRGLESGSRWLARTVSVASPEEVLALGLTPGASVCRLHRQRLADGVPLAEELAVVPTAFLPGPELVGTSLYQTLRRLGFPPHRALQRLSAVRITAETGRLLELPAGEAALYIERRTMMEDGTPLEFVRSHYRGDAYDFVVELNLVT
jgi:GntR family transcriptional regulator